MLKRAEKHSDLKRKMLQTLLRLQIIHAVNMCVIIKNGKRQNVNTHIKTAIVQSDTASLWKVVQKAKDVNTNDLPNILYEDSIPIKHL